MKFVVAVTAVLVFTLLLQNKIYASSTQYTPLPNPGAAPQVSPPTRQTIPLNYTPISLPGVRPLPPPTPITIPPLGPIAPGEDPTDSPEDPEDSGSIDELDVTEAGTVCTSPECLGDVNFSPLGTRAEGIDDVAAATLQYAFNHYSNSETVEEMISQARAHLAANPRAYIQRVKVRGRWTNRTLCYRAVKDAMRDSGMVPRSFQGSRHARDADSDLEALRSPEFVNLMDDPDVGGMLQNNPAMAPKGTILVYENAPGVTSVSPSGHVEIKTTDSGTHGYISISESGRPTYGMAMPRVRRLIGVMYRRDLANPPPGASAPAPSAPSLPY